MLDQQSVTLYSVEAEQALIGGLLIDPSQIPEVQEMLKFDDFFIQKNRVIMDAIEKLFDIDAQIDVITVAELAIKITGDDDLFTYIVELSSNVSGSANVCSYARIIAENAIKRRVMTMTQVVSTYILNKPQATQDDVLNFAQNAMLDMEANHNDGLETIDMNSAIKNYVADLDARFRSDGKINGYSTGFDAIDEITNGWRKGELIIIAGRPSMGKSTYALQSASKMSIDQGLRGLFFSLEMSTEQLTEKLMACHGKVPLKFLKNPNQYRDDETVWPKLELGARILKDKKFQLVHCPGMHINQLKAYARKYHRRQPLDFIVVDHIHLMDADGQSRERQLASISGALKALAGQLNIPVLALAQLNRGVESRTDKRPMMSDLRDSGSIEQDADIIQFVYRDDYYNDDPMNPNKGLVLIDTVKHRMGENGPAYLENRYDQSRLENSMRGFQFPQKQKSSYISKL